MFRTRKFRKFVRSCGEFIGVASALTVAIICAPILVPLAGRKAEKELERQTAVANVSSCSKCQSLLGVAAVNLASNENLARREIAKAALPGSRINFRNPPWQAICINCHAGLHFNEATDLYEFIEFVELTNICDAVDDHTE
jgi:hypothetical protein